MHIAPYQIIFSSIKSHSYFFKLLHLYQYAYLLNIQEMKPDYSVSN